MKSLSQHELVDRLVTIFPAFAAEWAADTECDEFASDSLCAVYQSFLPFVAGVRITDRQLLALSKLLNAEVAAGGEQENAVGTCFLEHCGQVGFARRLRPLLDAEACSRLIA